MEKPTFFLTSSLEKVFPGKRPAPLAGETLSAWAGTRAAVQMVYRGPDGCGESLVQHYTVSVEGAPAAELYTVELLPSDFPCWGTAVRDENYLTHSPGLFPDLLKPLPDGCIRPIPGQYRSVWISFPITEKTQAGTYEVTVTAVPELSSVGGNGMYWEADENCRETIRLSFLLRVGCVQLEDQRLLHTEWFHGDCLADYYHVEPLSEAHWRIMERFIRQAGCRHGINMLLTPVFTPPLDTAVGSERPTIQLVDIQRTAGVYSFDFSALKRWASICRESGIQYLEIVHLFTQWGARATPKIMALVDGVEQRIFGWDIPASSPDYRAFLACFIPALQTALESFGYDREHVYFHISDEPSEEHLDSYLNAKRQVMDLLEGCPVIDALSSFYFYQRGITEHPVPASDHIQPFLDAKIPDLWTYYCCVQGIDVPNRFYAMPSARNRIMGVLLYLYQIKGFLHWGYNFYYTQYSRTLADPYVMTHCDYGYPSGDAYLVYPGEDGTPMTSIRAEVQSEALSDLRALDTLEKKIGREAVERIIYNEEIRPFTFRRYPRQANFLLSLRERIFDALEQVE